MKRKELPLSKKGGDPKKRRCFYERWVVEELRHFSKKWVL